MCAAPVRPVVGIVVPVRAFAAAKARLADVLGPDDRARLMEVLADRVLAASVPAPVCVVSSAPEVRAWALDRGVPVLDDPGSLDGAAETGRAWAANQRCARVVVAHGDLPHARTLAGFARDAGRPVVAIAPCHRDDGTNVLSIPVRVPFRFAYGPGSFRRHGAEARRLGLAVRVVRDPSLAVDIDIPADLAALDTFPAGGA